MVSKLITVRCYGRGLKEHTFPVFRMECGTSIDIFSFAKSTLSMWQLQLRPVTYIIHHHHYVPSVVNRSAVMDLHRSRSCATLIQSLYDIFVHSLMLSVHIVLSLPRPLLPFILPSISNHCTPFPTHHLHIILFPIHHPHFKISTKCNYSSASHSTICNLCAICSQQVGSHGSPSFSILCHSNTVIV